jgi:small subunit ribosomal protein S27Ae
MPEKKKFISSYYKIEEGKIKRVLPTCDRCGPGYFMADHGDRYACGHCGFTKYKSAKNASSIKPEKTTS